MQFMNSSFKKLVKNLTDSDFKYLTQEFGSNNLELLKQKDAYPYEYIGSFERFSKDGATGDSAEKLDGHISDKDY